MDSRNLSGLVILISVCVVLGGCSKTEGGAGANAANKGVASPSNVMTQPQSGYISDRLASLVEDKKADITPELVRSTFKECVFNAAKNKSAELTATNCEIKKAESGRTREVEKINMMTYASDCCVLALKISQVQNDEEQGLQLFTAVGFSKESISCPNMDADNTASLGNSLFLVRKEGQPKFVIVEAYSGGSAGMGRDTTVFFGKDVVDCGYFSGIVTTLEDQQNEAGKAIAAGLLEQAAKDKPVEVISQEPTLVLFAESDYPTSFNWTKIYEDTDGTLYYDADSIIRDRRASENAVSYITMFNFSDQNMAGVVSRLKAKDIHYSKAVRISVSCELGVHLRNCSNMMYYSGKMGTGTYSFSPQCNVLSISASGPAYKIYDELDAKMCNHESAKVFSPPVYAGHGHLCGLYSASAKIGTLRIPSNPSDVEPPYTSSRASEEYRNSKYLEAEEKAKLFLEENADNLADKGIKYDRLDCTVGY